VAIGLRRALVILSLLVPLGVPATGRASLVVPLRRTPAQVEPGASPKLAPAIEALTRGQVETALRLAREYVKADPGSAPGQEVLGAAALASRQWSEAERALTEALRLEPRRVGAMVHLGQLALETGDPRKAETWFRQALAVSARLGPAHRGLAIALYRRGQVDGALLQLRDNVTLSGGKDLEAKYLLAAILHELGRRAEAERLLADVLAAEPDLAQPLLLQGLVKLELGKTDEAIPSLKHLADQHPGSLWARLGGSLLQRAQGELGPARAALEQLTQDRPDWALAHSQLAQVLLLEGRLDAALRAFERAEQVSPNPAIARLRSAALLLAAQQHDAAIARARAVLGIASVAAPARAIIVQAYLAKGSPELAERELTAAAAAAPGDPRWPVQLGRLYLAQGRSKDALIQFVIAEQRRPGTVDAIMGQAEARVALGQAKEAVSAAEELVRAQREAPDALVYLGSIHERLGQPQEAAAAYRRALDRERHHLAAARALARLSWRDGRKAEAIRILEDAAAAHPDSPLPLLELAQLHDAAGSPGPAIAAYRRALQRDVTNPALLNNLAYLLGADPATLDEALGLAEQAYRRAPRSPAIADTLGWLLYQKGDVERAEPLLVEAVRTAPTDPRIRYHLGMVYAKRGKASEARRELGEALRSGSLPEAASAQKTLDALR